MIKIQTPRLILFVISLVLTVNAYAQPGLVSYWPGDGNASDVAGGNSGILLNGANYRPGASGQAFSFDGVDDLFQASTNGFPTYDGDRTLAMWVKVDAPVAGDAIFGGYGAFGTTYAVYSLGQSSNGTYASNGGGGIGGPGLLPGRWYHIAATNVTSHLTLYLDGNVIGQTDLAISTPAGTQFYSGRIAGAVGDNTRLKGAVDEIRVFDRALSASEIQGLYNQISPPPPEVTSGLVSYWPADGNTNDAIGSNNGTLLNGATYRTGVSGQAFSFDGVDDWFEAPTNSFPTNNWERTLAMWVKVDAPVTQEAFFGGYGAFGLTYSTYHLGAGSGLFASSWGTGVGGPSLQSGRWYHVAVTNVLDVLTLYLDGNVVATAHNIAVSTPYGTQFYSGRIPGTNGDIRRLKGAVDEIRVYNRSLTASEIHSLVPADSTPPVVTPTVSGTQGNNGWYTSDVGVSWSVEDGESAMSSSTGCITSNITTDTVGLTFTCSATSVGGTGTESVTIKRDAAAPSVSCAAADGNWHASDASIACTASDAISGLSASGDGSFNLSTSVPAGSETANAITGSRQVCDAAGNCAAAGPVSGNKIDKKAPVITVTAPTAGSYLLNQAVAVGFTCVDGGSGVANCTGTTVNGGALDTISAGAKTFTVSSTDNAGNAASPTNVNYSVNFGITVLFDQTKAHKSGSTVPIKIRLVDANGANVSSAATIVHAVSVIQTSSQASTTLDDAGNSNPDLDFRYDAGLGGYIFNLKTTGYGTGTYLLNFVAGNSPTVYSVGFQVRQ